MLQSNTAVFFFHLRYRKLPLGILEISNLFFSQRSIYVPIMTVSKRFKGLKMVQAIFYGKNAY